jgi:small-conductance mechanosensitive channel
MHWLIKRTIKKLKKNGKMAYEPFATMAFTNNTIMHITPASKSSISYSLIEHVSIIPRKVIYIHINNLTSYILPFSCFTSEEQYSYFVTFIKTKCKKVKYYKQ